MTKEKFIEWIENAVLNLNGLKFLIDETVCTKNNFSSVSLKCVKKNNSWCLIKTGPSDRTSAECLEIICDSDEENFFMKVKEYLEDEDYVNRLCSK